MNKNIVELLDAKQKEYQNAGYADCCYEGWCEGVPFDQQADWAGIQNDITELLKSCSVEKYKIVLMNSDFYYGSASRPGWFIAKILIIWIDEDTNIQTYELELKYE